MDFKAKLVSADERGAMLSSYPGDPLERQEGIYVSLQTKDIVALDDWFQATMPGRAMRFYPDADLLEVNWAKSRMEDRFDMVVVYFVKDKRDIMLIRLAFA